MATSPEKMFGSGKEKETLNVERVAIAATGTDNTLVAAISGKKIRVLQLVMVASAALVARFESGTGGTALTGQMSLAANQLFTLPYSPHGWFETAAGSLLNLELSTSACHGFLIYAEL
jgi:hypothetical protein